MIIAMSYTNDGFNSVSRGRGTGRAQWDYRAVQNVESGTSVSMPMLGVYSHFLVILLSLNLLIYESRHGFCDVMYIVCI